jgi:hypothetical protein
MKKRHAASGKTQKAVGNTPFHDWLLSTFAKVFEIRHYWKDRRRILANVACIREPRKLEMGPFAFALSGVILPGLILGLIFGAARAVYEFPPLPVDREIQSQNDLSKSLQLFAQLQGDSQYVEPSWAKAVSNDQINAEARALGNRAQELMKINNRSQSQTSELSAVRQRGLALAQVSLNRSMREVSASRVTLQRSLTQHQLLLLSVKKFGETMESWSDLIIPFGLMLNAYVFAWWFRKMPTHDRFRNTAASAYLYVFGSVFLLPSLALNVFNLVTEFSERYQWNNFLLMRPVLVDCLALWFVLALWRTSRLISRALDVQNETARQKWAFFGRMLLSQTAVGVALQLTVAVAAMPVLFTIWKLQK